VATVRDKRKELLHALAVLHATEQGVLRLEASLGVALKFPRAFPSPDGSDMRYIAGRWGMYYYYYYDEAWDEIVPLRIIDNLRGRAMSLD
jgi:hypothetical protein